MKLRRNSTSSSGQPLSCHKKDPVHYPKHIILITVFAFLLVVVAAFGIYFSFYFNETFAKALYIDRTVEVTEPSVRKITDNYMDELASVGNAIAEDLTRKMSFFQKAVFDSFEDILKNPAKRNQVIEDSNLGTNMVVKSGTWRFINEQISRNLAATKLSSRNLVDRYKNTAEFYSNYTVTKKRSVIQEWLQQRSQLCRGYVEGSNLYCGSNFLSREMSFPPFTSNCYTSAIPLLPEDINPFDEAGIDPDRMLIDIHNNAAQFDRLARRNGEMIPSYSFIMSQISDMQDNMSTDFVTWAEYETEWFNEQIKYLESDTCKEETIVNVTTQRPATTTVPTKKADRGKTDEKKEKEEAKREKQGFDYSHFVEVRNSVVITLLTLALLQIIATCIGCFSLLYAFFNKSPAANSRWEIVGRRTALA